MNPLIQLLICIIPAFTFFSCQQGGSSMEVKKNPTDPPIETVDTTRSASPDSSESSIMQKEEFIPKEFFGYYRAYTPPSFLLDENGKKTEVNGNPVEVPATVNYMQIKDGKIYGVQMAQGHQFLFTGFYDYSKESLKEKGVLNLTLDGRFLKTGKPVGGWNPQIEYTKSDNAYEFTLVGVSGAPDSKMKFISEEISTARMQELMKEEESGLK